MKQEVLVGQTDYTVLVLIRDTDGAPATALTEASIDIAYARVETDNDVTTTDVTPAALAALTTAHTDWGFEEVSATDHPGLYRLDIADAVFASGAWSAVVSIVGTGLDPCQIEFVLVNHSPFSAIADILTDTAVIGAAGAGLTEAGGTGDHLTAINLPNQTMDITGNITGNLSGSVGSVTGAVGSVTGAVGSVTGAVGSVTGSIGSLAAQAKADVNAEVDTAISDAALATAANLATVAGYIDTEVAAVLAAVDTEVAAIKLKTDNLPTDPADQSLIIAATDAITSAIAALNNISVADVLAGTVEGSTTLAQSLRLLNAALGGKASGLETTTAVYRNLADDKDRISATVDADGNRSAVTLDLT